MDVLSTAVPTKNGTVETVDTIEFAGTLWLVPLWHDTPDGKLTMPIRIVCLSLLPHRKLTAQVHDYSLDSPLPIDIYDYQNPIEPKNGLIVVDLAKLQIPRDRRVS